MPNWCSNTITLKHKDSAQIDRAYRALQNETFLNEFLPVPPFRSLDHEPGLSDSEVENKRTAVDQENLDLYGAKDWYDWCVANWGTKWDVGDEDSTERVDANTIQASFDSAWAPPCQAYEYLVSLGFEITAYYEEPGMAFCGKWTGDANGFEDDYREYDGESSRTVREVIGEELDDYFAISENMSYMEEQHDDDEDEQSHEDSDRS